MDKAWIARHVWDPFSPEGREHLTLWLAKCRFRGEDFFVRGILNPTPLATYNPVLGYRSLD